MSELLKAQIMHLSISFGFGRWYKTAISGVLKRLNYDSSCHIGGNGRNHTGGIDEYEIDKALSFYKQA